MIMIGKGVIGEEGEGEEVEEEKTTITKDGKVNLKANKDNREEIIIEASTEVVERIEEEDIIMIEVKDLIEN